MSRVLPGIERRIDQIRSPLIREWTHALVGTELRGNIKRAGSTFGQLVPNGPVRTSPADFQLRIEPVPAAQLTLMTQVKSGDGPEKTPASGSSLKPDQPKKTRGGIKALAYGVPIAAITLFKTALLPATLSVPIFSDAILAGLNSNELYALALLANNALPGLGLGILAGLAINWMIRPRVKTTVPPPLPAAPSEPPAPPKTPSNPPPSPDLTGEHNTYWRNGIDIGNGGMGVVIQARNSADKLAAVKFLPIAAQVAELKQKFSVEELRPKVIETLRRFYDEYTSGRSMHHPNIGETLDTNIKVVFPDIDDYERFKINFSLDHLENIPPLFIALEFIPKKAGSAVPAETLIKYTSASRGIRPSALVGLFLPLIDGLVYAHRNGIYHRDIKPQNIMSTIVRDREIFKLIDFGIAKDEEKKTALTQAGEFPGSFYYQPPDQIKHAAKKDPAANRFVDIFQIGLVMYECLTGSNPRRDKPSEAFDPARISTQEIADPELRAIIIKLLADHDGTPGSGHFDSLEDVQQALQALGGSQPGGRVSQSMFAKARTAAAAPPPRFIPPPPRRPQSPVREYLTGSRSEIISDMEALEDRDISPEQALDYTDKLAAIRRQYSKDRELLAVWQGANYLVSKIDTTGEDSK